MMRNFISIACICLFCMSTGCESNHDPSTETGSLVGYSQTELTMRDVKISTEQGFLNVTCYVDAYGQETCHGTFDNGETASDEQIETSLNTLQIDPRLDEALKSDCHQKTLLLAVEPKVDVVSIDIADFCFWTDNTQTTISCNGDKVSQEEAEAMNLAQIEALNKKRLEAREAGLEKFIEHNPGLVDDDQKALYLEALYGALNIKIPACEWEDFISRNEDILHIVELRALVEEYTSVICENSVDYQVLLETTEYRDNSLEKSSYKILSSQEELAAYKAIGVTDEMIESVDFEKDIVLYLSAGTKGTLAYSLKIEDICVDSKIDVQVVYCAGQNADDALSDPTMLLQLPKANYEAEFTERALVCE